MEHKTQRGAGFIWGLLAGVVLTTFVAVLGYGVGSVAVKAASNTSLEVATWSGI